MFCLSFPVEVRVALIFAGIVIGIIALATAAEPIFPFQSRKVTRQVDALCKTAVA
jgi:hypothetical protein